LAKKLTRKSRIFLRKRVKMSKENVEEQNQHVGEQNQEADEVSQQGSYEEKESSLDIEDMKEAAEEEPNNEGPSDNPSSILEDDSDNDKIDKEISTLKKEVGEAKDKYLRLYSEFENFRRRSAREKLDLIQTANEDLMVVLLPVIDDFRRAMAAFSDNKDPKAFEEGLSLIENKLKRSLEQKGLKSMNVKEGDDFNPEFHEAVSQMPAPKKKLIGKIVDTIEDGYFLGEKVIRYAKVVIGS